MTITTLFQGKLSGRTSADAEIASQDITFDGTGRLRWTDANGVEHSIPVNGKLAELLEVLFTGTGGTTHVFFK
jgi:hypothetical protein